MARGFTIFLSRGRIQAKLKPMLSASSETPCSCSSAGCSPRRVNIRKQRLELVA
jgi:hypothetical protein